MISANEQFHQNRKFTMALLIVAIGFCTLMSSCLSALGLVFETDLQWGSGLLSAMATCFIVWFMAIDI